MTPRPGHGGLGRRPTLTVYRSTSLELHRHFPEIKMLRLNNPETSEGAACTLHSDVLELWSSLASPISGSVKTGTAEEGPATAG